MNRSSRVAAILGAADGLTIAISFVFGRDPAVFHSALDAGIGEFVGMGAALYLSADGGENKKLIPALVCGLTTLVACVLPALPYLAIGGNLARLLSAAVAAIVAALVCKIRPEKGWVAVAETYGVLIAAGLLCFLASLVP